MRDYLKRDDLEEVKTLEDIFGYLSDSLMPQLFPDETWYNGDPYKPEEQVSILHSWPAWLIGCVRRNCDVTSFRGTN